VFIGHTAVALAIKRVRPSVPLWALVAAAYGPDVIEITLLLLWRWGRVTAAFGSHSIPSIALGAMVVGVAYWIWRREVTGSVLLGEAYASHWVADLFTGTGKPTWGGGPSIGLELYEHPPIDFLVESALLIAAWALLWPAGDRRRRRRRALDVAVPAGLLLLQLTFNAAERLFGVRSLKGALTPVRTTQRGGDAPATRIVRNAEPARPSRWS
jgi:hypothetical protein